MSASPIQSKANVFLHPLATLKGKIITSIVIPLLLCTAIVFGGAVTAMMAAQTALDALIALTSEKNYYYEGYELTELSKEVSDLEPDILSVMDQLGYDDNAGIEVALAICAAVTDNGKKNIDNPFGVIFPDGWEHTRKNSIELGVMRMQEASTELQYPPLAMVYAPETAEQKGIIANYYYFLQTYMVGSGYVQFLYNKNYYDKYNYYTETVGVDANGEMTFSESENEVELYAKQALNEYSEEYGYTGDDYWGDTDLPSAIRPYYDQFQGRVRRYGTAETKVYSPDYSATFDIDAFNNATKDLQGRNTNADLRANPDGTWTTWPGIGTGQLQFPTNITTVTSLFGDRTHPISREVRHHDGMDFACPTGTPIYASEDGRIIMAYCAPGENPYSPIENIYAGGYTSYQYGGTDPWWGGSLGRYIVIDHGDRIVPGKMTETIYGHMSYFAEGIEWGTEVKKGQLIGYSGTSGYSTGPHLHFEVEVSYQPYDPELFL